MQINEAMFVGSGGWVLKPPALLGVTTGRKIRFTVEVVGVSARTVSIFVFSFFACLIYVIGG